MAVELGRESYAGWSAPSPDVEGIFGVRPDVYKEEKGQLYVLQMDKKSGFPRVQMRVRGAKLEADLMFPVGKDYQGVESVRCLFTEKLGMKRVG